MSSQQLPYLRIPFRLLTYSFLPVSSTVSHTGSVEPNDPHVSDLSVSHYDCSEEHDLRQFSLTRVQPCVQAFSSLESNRGIASAFVRAKAKRPINGSGKRKLSLKILSAQSEYRYRRHDRVYYLQNTIERPRTLDSSECTLSFRHLNAFDSSSSTFFDDS